MPTGIEHGTITVVIDSRPFEVTTLREDVETFGRHANVRFGRDWRKDAERRDFTMNALSANSGGLWRLSTSWCGRSRSISTATISAYRILRAGTYGCGPLACSNSSSPTWADDPKLRAEVNVIAPALRDHIAAV